MKVLAVLATLTLAVAALVQGEEAGTTHVHVHQAKRPEVEERAVDYKAVEKRREMFERIAHMKETPWDADATEKQAKCDDFCLLVDFWNFQRARNCDFRPTGLCMPYKLGLAGLDAVLTVADCTCGDNSTSASASGSVGEE